MSTKIVTTEQVDAALKGALDILDRAKRAGRPLTEDERAEVTGYQADGARLVRQMHKERDDEFRTLVAGMGKSVVARVDGSPVFGDSSHAGGVKAPGPWAKAFDAAREQYGEKALISPSGSVGVPSPLSVLAPIGDKVETILQLIPGETINSDAYAFLRETVRMHNADTVSVSGTKPTSVYTVERVEHTAETIAHLSEPIPRQYLADAPLLNRYLDGVLREGLQLALEEQVIAGSGVAPDLEGILSASNTLAQPFTTDVLTTCRKAVTALELYSVIPDAWVFHPSDWETLELLTSSDHYLMGQGQGQALPVDKATRRLWGYRVALSLGITQGTAILADFAGSTHLWEREGARVDWSENIYDSVAGKTDFERNLVRYRAEGRWGFAVIRPSGVCVVDLEAGS